jgi:hypothetical protein
VAISEDAGVVFTPSQIGVAAGGYSTEAVWDRPLAVGESACWRVELAEERVESFQLRAACNRGEEVWSALVGIDVPYDITKSVW